jgi:hypothetical protein
VTRHRPEAGRGREREHRLPNLGTREWTTEEACASEAQICMRARVHRLKSLVDPHKSLIASKAVRKRGRNTRTPVHLCQGVSVLKAAGWTGTGQLTRKWRGDPCGIDSNTIEAAHSSPSLLRLGPGPARILALSVTSALAQAPGLRWCRSDPGGIHKGRLHL